MPLKFDMDSDPFREVEDRQPPEGGWKKACTVADHKWTLSVEDGRPGLVCMDPHPEAFAGEVDPERGLPVCMDPYWEPEDLYAEGVPVSVRHVDDSTPSTPNGPAEYGFWLEVGPPVPRNQAGPNAIDVDAVGGPQQDRHNAAASSRKGQR